MPSNMTRCHDPCASARGVVWAKERERELRRRRTPLSRPLLVPKHDAPTPRPSILPTTLSPALQLPHADQEGVLPRRRRTPLSRGRPHTRPVLASTRLVCGERCAERASIVGAIDQRWSQGSACEGRGERGRQKAADSNSGSKRRRREGERERGTRSGS